jgi:hypothetical protein
MTDIQKNLKSQADFIKEIDKPHLGEFLCRFKTTNGSSVLSRMIMDELRHITFHLIPTQCGNNTGRGPIHAINDRSTRKAQRVRINTVKTMYSTYIKSKHTCNTITSDSARYV